MSTDAFAKRIHLMSLKRIVFWSLLMLFIVMSICWMLFFPFNKERLYSAISEDALVISRHVQLADRWTLIAESPVLPRAAAALGMDEDAISELIENRSLAGHLRRFAGRETIMAYSKPHRETLAETITVASWVGIYGQFLRWGFLNKALSGFEVTRLKDGTRIWQQRNESLDDRVVSLCIYEGVAVTCLSRDPVAAARCRQRMALSAPIVVPLNPSLTPHTSNTTTVDHVWIRGKHGEWSGSGELTRWTPDIFSGTVRTPSSLLPTGYINDSTADHISRMLGDAPDTLMIASWKDVATTLSEMNNQQVISNVCSAIETIAEPKTPVFAALLSGMYSGRVMKLRVPSLVIGFQTTTTNAPLTAAEMVLDKLNAAFDLGLIPKRTQRNDAPFIALDTIRSSGLGLMATEERPALSVMDDWLLIGSNARVLETLLRQHDSRTQATSARWLSHFPSGGCASFGWTRTAPTADAITGIKAVTAMAMMLNHSKQYGKVRPAFDAAQKWIDLFGTVGECALSIDSDQGLLQTHFRLDLDSVAP
ncbi:MAG: hypothetical protein ISS35_01170 [Kiritimatiellae bacterium]|nr:hypothetical protein [Kiritimatiellia bacterium]